MDLVDRALAGERRALGRLMSLIENRAPDARAALRRVYPRTGRARVIGVTGAPGSGKSTLVNRLALAERARGRTVGIVAVDPSSPISGGAVLGDRVRMQELSGDDGIFVRSMAARETLGGLAETTGELVQLLDAVGKDVVFVETVGVGQAEVDIVREAQTIVVVLAPGMGDDVQAMKAGLMEIADVFVVNKADRDGADAVVAQVHSALSLAPAGPWTPPIIKTAASLGQGIEAALAALGAHDSFLRQQGRLMARRTEQARRQVLALAQQALVARLGALLDDDPALRAAVVAVAERRADPFAIAAQLAARLDAS